MTQHSDLLNSIRAQRKIARPQRPYAQRTSKLARHRHAIAELQTQGATLGEIQHYLRAMATPSIQVERSTILRYLNKLND